jgi:hypothetical protein
MTVESHNKPVERIFECSSEGPALSTVRDCVDVMGEAMAVSATLVILPVSRLDPAFFQLRTGLAGEVLQKFVIYRLKVVILGDYAQLASDSIPLRDFIRESNRGNSIWFVVDKKDLEKRLGP